MDRKHINAEQAKVFIEKYWDDQILPSLSDFVRIPNLSKQFDQKWNENGLLDKAANHILNWSKNQNIKGFKGEILKEPDRSPFVFIEIDGTTADTKTILYYGHFDKQPHLEGWAEGLSPTDPVVKNNKLYGRGGADDGYSIYAIIAGIKICQDQGLAHPRCVITIEGNEESGSGDYPIYLEKIKSRIGQISVVIGVDGGGITYDTFWFSNSLRGCMVATLKVKVLKEGVHSGEASGIVPSSFRIMRQLLDRIEDPLTGEMHPDFNVIIPPHRYNECCKIAQKYEKEINTKYPLLPGMSAVTNRIEWNILNNAWKPTLCIIGADGMPPSNIAGNVLRPETTLQLSIRLPPTLNAEYAAKRLKEILEKDPPYGAEVTCNVKAAMAGWNAHEMNPELLKSIDSASKSFYGKESAQNGEGASIPLIGLLQGLFPQSQFIICGILGPGSNAHSQNEQLDIPCLKSLIGCLAQICNDYYYIK